jgi:hypothetical protein
MLIATLGRICSVCLGMGRRVLECCTGREVDGSEGVVCEARFATCQAAVLGYGGDSLDSEVDEDTN